MKKTRKPALRNAEVDNTAKEWPKFFVLGEHWQSDLKFFKDELRFLQRIIKRFLLWINEDENILRTRSLVNQINETEQNRKILEDQVQQHMHHIREVMENPFTYDETKVRDEHLELERSFSEFVKKFKILKGHVFVDAERVIEQEEELNRFLGT